MSYRPQPATAPHNLGTSLWTEGDNHSRPCGRVWTAANDTVVPPPLDAMPAVLSTGPRTDDVGLDQRLRGLSTLSTAAMPMTGELHV